MKSPSDIKIWGHSYSIRYEDDPRLGEKPSSVWGYCDTDKHEIALRNSLKNRPSFEIEVLIHELLHAVARNSNTFGMMDDAHKVEEHVVDTLSNGFTLILKDNPTLIDYIKERLHGK